MIKINPKNFISQIQKTKLTVSSIWTWEVAFSIVLLLILLALDFWIYVNFAIRPPQQISNGEDFVLFKKYSVDRTVKKIQNYVEFLDKPSFPSAPNPF